MTDLPYRTIWERELRAGMYGQDRMKPSTWKIDGLYRAVCWQTKAEEAESFVRLAMEQGAHPDSVARLLREAQHVAAQAHRIFIKWEREHGKPTAA